MINLNFKEVISHCLIDATDRHAQLFLISNIVGITTSIVIESATISSQ